MAGKLLADADPALVLGLGNPGDKYAATRHNLGFMVVTELSRRHGIVLKRGGLSTRKLQSLWGRGQVGGRAVIAALPMTFMNNSGQAAASMLAYFDFSPGQMLVVHDDADLGPGRIKVAVRGGAAGHKGVLSIQSCVGTDRFIRLRVGIGRPRNSQTMEDYVLSGFSAPQRGMLAQTVDMAADCLEVILTQGPQTAMERFHHLNKQTVEGEG